MEGDSEPTLPDYGEMNAEINAGMVKKLTESLSQLPDKEYGRLTEALEGVMAERKELFEAESRLEIANAELRKRNKDLEEELRSAWERIEELESITPLVEAIKNI